MQTAALFVLIGVAAATIYAWRLRPGRQFFDDVAGLWQSGPWPRQIILDFYGLEIVLALWMATHAAETGNWATFAVCAATMPLFGAVPAAAHWLLAVT